MKTLRIAAVAAALVSAAAIAGCEKKEPTLGEKVEQTGKTVGASIGTAGKAAIDAAKSAAKSIEKEAKDAADVLDT